MYTALWRAKERAVRKSRTVMSGDGQSGSLQRRMQDIESLLHMICVR